MTDSIISAVSRLRPVPRRNQAPIEAGGRRIAGAFTFPAVSLVDCTLLGTKTAGAWTGPLGLLVSQTRWQIRL